MNQKEMNLMQKRQNQITPRNAKRRISLSEYFKSGISLAELKEGEYEAEILKFTLIEATQTSPEYVRIDLKLPDRVTNDNRFAVGFRIFESQIKRQLGIEDKEMSIPELCQTAMKQPIKVWVSYYTDPSSRKRYRNINYLAPETTQETDEPTTSETTEPEIPKFLTHPRVRTA